ncbi:MAG: hypothetical protein AAF708_04365 [Deinococcota bacterium]
MPEVSEQLQLGPFEFTFEDGALRYLRAGGHDLLWQIYAAVRDANWGTIPGEIEDVIIYNEDHEKHIYFTSVHEQADIQFIWSGHIHVNAAGWLTFEFDGEAESTFDRNRIGFCVLHPMTAAGADCTIEHVDGSISEGQFPTHISPHQPFMDICAITHEVTPALSVKVTMEGDTFEMEDQRNWTDASFKTYCTPLAEPFPVTVREGDTIQQRITVELLGDVPSASTESEDVRVTLSETRSSLPQLGLCSSSPLSNADLEHLRNLNLDHLRVDVHLDKYYQDHLEQQLQHIHKLSCGLELAVHATDDADTQLEHLANFLNKADANLSRLLVFHENEKSTSSTWLNLARKHFPDTPLAGGTDAFFTELNRERPDTTSLDLLTYSLNPQVHAFDDASLIETLPVQAVTVHSAQTFSNGKPVIVSPVTFKMRSNPNATEGGTLSLDEKVDPRQGTLFGAGWTLGSLAHLLTSSVTSLTYFDTVGLLGVITGADNSDASAVYPLYHVLADVAEFKDGEISLCSSSHSLVTNGIVLQHADTTRILLANHSPSRQTITLNNIQGRHTGRVLDASTEDAAMLTPDMFRAEFPLAFEAVNGQLEVTLEPHALITLDSLPAGAS